MAESFEMPMLPADISMGLAHNGIRFSLASAEVLVNRARGDRDRRALVADFYSAALLGLKVHHDGEEELLFPLLIERFPDERGAVERGAEQHHHIVPAVQVAAEAIEAWSSDSEDESDRVVSALKALDEVVSVHLDYEEAAIVPIEGRLSVGDRRTYLDKTRDHHIASIPNMIGFLLSRFHGAPLLMDAVGESSFREMIAIAQQG
jgi:hemerythrin HHE cation binding domain-containing protein